MLKNFLKNFLSLFKSRILICALIFAGFSIVLIHRLYNLQIVNGEDYLNTFTYRIQKNVELPARRGTIYDCNGVPLAYDKLAYTISIGDSALLTDNDTRNAMISKLLDLADACGDTLACDMPIQQEKDGSLTFSAGENTILRFKKDIYSSETLTEQQKEASAEDVYNYMRSEKLFNLDSSIDMERALRILSIRYDLYMKRYEKYLSVEVDSNASEKMIAAVRENQNDLPGVSVEKGYTRVYNDSKYFSAITGYIGSISEEELTELEEKGETGYSQNDKIGKNGIEAYCEDQLKGQKGSQILYVNSMGSILETADTIEPTPGKDIYLSIDAEFTKKAYDMMEARIAGILLQNMTDYVNPDYNPDHLVPIKDFYFALINNNVVSLDHLTSQQATKTEKAFAQKVGSYEDNILLALPQQMNTSMEKLSEEYSAYIYMAYDMLKEDGILKTGMLNDSSDVMTGWSGGSTSFASLLQYAVSQNAIDLNQLDLNGEYYDSQQIYQAVVSYIQKNITGYSGFEKKVIYYMLNADALSGTDICLLLYEQNILEKDSSYSALADGSLSAKSFMYNKIYQLQITPDMLALTPCSGSYIMTDNTTGKVKAFVSYPGYDANKINNVSYYSSLINNASAPLYNHVTQQLLAPGSTFKPVSAAAGLEEGVITKDTYIYDNTTFTKVQPPANDWTTASHGNINVAQAIEYSCNYFFYELGYRLSINDNNKYDADLGLSRLQKYAKAFGLDETSGLELTESQPHISDEDPVRSAIGQSKHEYTAAELARYVTAVATKGTLYNLTLIDHTSDHDGSNVQENKAKVERTIDLQDSTWEQLHYGMYMVCNESYYAAKMSGYGVTIAGKSGTAQESEKKSTHSLFVGFAPYDDPQVTAVIIIPNGFGSSTVLDLYTDLMCTYFNIPVDRNDDGEEDYPDDPAKRTANIPESSIASD